MRRKDRQVTDNRSIESIIERSDVCRIAFADGDIPYVVTMNFGYSGGAQPRLFFHCAGNGRKLDMLRKNNYVCFEMDTDHQIYKGEKGCDWGMRFSSIVGYGHIRIVTDENEKINGLDLIMKHYGGGDHKGYVTEILKKTTILRLDVEEISAKKKG